MVIREKVAADAGVGRRISRVTRGHGREAHHDTRSGRVASYVAMNEAIFRAVRRVMDLLERMFAIKLPSPIESRPNEVGAML